MSALLSDISDGAILPCCARRIYTIEANLRLRHLNAGSDYETLRNHTTAANYTHADLFSHRTARSPDPVPIVSPSIQPIRPVVAQIYPAIFPPDSSRLTHDQVRDGYNSLSAKNMDKLILHRPVAHSQTI